MVLEKEKKRNIMAWLVRKQVICWENALTGTSSTKDSVLPHPPSSSLAGLWRNVLCVVGDFNPEKEEVCLQKENAVSDALKGMDGKKGRLPNPSQKAGFLSGHSKPP